MLPLVICSAMRIDPGTAPSSAAADAPSPEVETELPQNDPAGSEGYEQVYDSAISLSVMRDGIVQEMTMAEYLPLALAGEMPASFEEEALKAQAVALRTYVLYYSDSRKDGHPDADICDDSACCAAAMTEAAMREKWGEGYDECLEKLRAAVSETDGQYLTYSGETALTVFHSSSEGATEDGGNIWNDLPYLRSVETPETEQSVTNLHSTVEVDAAEFKATILATCPDAVLGEDPAQWIGETILNSSGRVGSISIGGLSVSGTAVRNMFSLRSSNFKLSYSDGVFVFDVSGYGHGVGMSQYGANILASQGEDYSAILAHYYPGTELVVSVIVRK